MSASSGSGAPPHEPDGPPGSSASSLSPPSTPISPAFELTSHAAAERLLWLDMEMTNIGDPSLGRIMEVGVVVTGPTSEWLSEDEDRGVCVMYHRVLRLTPEELANSSAWSKSHHVRRRPGSGMSLMELCSRSTFSLEEVESDLIAIARFHGGGRPMMLAGSSVSCDRVFIDRYMPGLASILHHRTVDVSTVLELCRRMYPGLRIPAPIQPQGTQHTAMGDILASLRLMHWLQNTVFMPGLITKQHEGSGSAAGMGGGGGFHPAYLHHQPHWQMGPAGSGGGAVGDSGQGRHLIVRQAPPQDGTPSVLRPSAYAMDPVLLATANHGFPLARRSMG
jgi:oligoribonuclease